MASQILRPARGARQSAEWVIQGSWGRRKCDAMSKVALYEQLHHEMIAHGVLPLDSSAPSNRYHTHVTMTVMRCSWIEGRWVRDEPFAARLKTLRGQASLTQEQLAERSGLDIGTIRQLEQGTRTKPQWQTVCGLARALDRDVIAFVGAEG